MRKLITLFFISLLLSACGTQATPTQVPATATSIPTPIPPSPTPGKPLVVLLVPADMSDSQKQAYEKTIYDLAQAEGYRFQVLNSMTPEEMDPALKIVIALPPDPGIAELAAAAPQAQFLAVNIPGITPGGNVSVIGGESGNSAEIAPYLAGYIASMLSQDYRIGMIGEKDSEQSGNAAGVLKNARVYYCGLCQAAAPPWYDYPVIVEIPAGTDESQMPAYADVLRDRYVYTAYIYPSMSNSTLLNYMASSGINMIGEITPPDSVRSNWVASIQPDWLAAIEKAWPDLVAGNGGQTIPSPLTLTDINPELLTPGKQVLAQRILDELVEGVIGTKP